MKPIKNMLKYVTFYSHGKNYILYIDDKFYYEVEINFNKRKNRGALEENSIYKNYVTTLNYKYDIISIKRYRKNKEVKNYKTIPLFQNIGMEWEFNRYVCKYDNVLGGDVEPCMELTPPFSYLKNENSKIWEAITEPLSIHNIPLLLGVGYKMAKAGAIKEQKGKFDPLAGSIHTHIDLHNLGLWYYDFLYKKLKFIKNLEHKNTFFFKKTLNTKFRTGLTKNNSAVSDYFTYRFNYKGSKLTLNYSKEKKATLEFRINESPYPLWAFLLPSVFFTDNEEYDLKYSLQYWKRFLRKNNYKILEKVIPVYFEMQGDGKSFTNWLENNQEVMDLNW